MIRLFALKDIKSISEEALYKIVVKLDPYGLTVQNAVQFDSYDEIFEAAQTALSEGDYVLIAAEPEEFLKFKFEFISKNLLLEQRNDGLSQLISANYINTSRYELDDHCTVPSRSTVHASADGLFSGFSVELLNGLCTVLPLDFGRLDAILSDYIVAYIDPSIGYVPPKIEINPVVEDNLPANIEAPTPGRECKEAVAKMIYSLIQVDKTIAIANSEAALHIYNMYDQISGLSDVASFVEIIDPEEGDVFFDEAAQPDDELEVTKFVPQGEPTYEPVLDDEGNPVFDDDGNPVFELVAPKASEEEMPVAQPKPKTRKETASAKTVRHAREAMRNMRSTFGAAISEVYSTVDDDGKESFFVFFAISDGKTVKAKKLGTDNPNEADDLIFHAITFLSESVIRKVDAISASLQRAKAEQTTQLAPVPAKKKLSPVIIAAVAVILIFAVGAPLFIINGILKDETTTSVPIVPQISDTSPYVSETVPSSQQAVPGMDVTASIPGMSDPLKPAEPAASEVSAATSASVPASTSGKFTFYVFGYGHGVGLSQTGADYYAKKGWNYAQILANYFYGTTIMSGDKYPEKINYNGTDYNTRDFIAGALEAEMGSSAHPEALKAQAVCIYTFAKYYGYKIDTSAMAYKSTAAQACYQAADFVINNGLYIAYGGQTALTPFHSTSAGKTTSYYNAWGGTALNYLAGGRPSYGDYESNDFRSTVTLSSAELKSLIESNDSSIKLSGDPSTWISILTHDSAVDANTGYVSTIRVGGKEVSGNTFRTKLLNSKIKSHCFTFVYTPDTV